MEWQTQLLALYWAADWGNLTQEIKVDIEIEDMIEIPHFPASTGLEGHHGKLILGTSAGKAGVAAAPAVAFIIGRRLHGGAKWPSTSAP